MLAALHIAFAGAVGAAIPYERPLTAPVYGPAPGRRGFAVGASDGREVLVVWNDVGRAALYATRLAADGTVLDDTGVRIESVGPLEGTPLWVFWAGNAYVIFWNESSGLYSARLDAEAKILDAPHPVLDERVASMAANSARFVASYGGDRLAVLDLEARTIERGVVVPQVDPAASVSLTANGIGFIASWVTRAFFGTSLNVAVLDAFGHPAGQPRIIETPAGVPPVAASNGNDYLFVLRQSYGAAPYTLRISAAGQPLGTRALPVAPETSRDTLRWTGSQYVYTSIGQGIVALRLDAAGVPIDAAPATLTPDAAEHVTAQAGGTLLLVWNTVPAMKAAAVSLGTLKSAAPVVVAISAAEQRAPRIAFSGRNTLVTWQESDTIYAARLDAEGRVLDPGGIAMAHDAHDANVVFDGNAFVVAWQTNDSQQTLWLNRIDPDSGARLNGAGVAAIQFVCSYGLAASCIVTMVAFEGCDGRVQVMRVGRALEPLDMPLRIAPSSGPLARNPSVAWNGTQWLVAFEDGGNVRAVRISSALTPLDTQPLLIAAGRAPHATSGGYDSLIAWTRGAGSVAARRLHPDGTLGKEIAVAAGVGTDAIWTGHEYAVAFTSTTGDALGATIGDAEIGAFFKVEASTDPEQSLALVAGNGRVTGAYARIATEPLYGGVSRVFVRDARPLHGRAASH